jgi:hypothetical protein
MVISRDSLGMLVTKGLMSQPKPVGMSRVREIALDIHAAVFLFKPPIRVDSPEESAVLADGLFALIGCVGIGHLSDSGGVRAAVPAPRIEWRIMYVVIGVQSDGDDFLFSQAVVDCEIIPLVSERTRANHPRPINVLVATVVLHQGDGLTKIGARNENRSQPMMDDGFRRLELVTG